MISRIQCWVDEKGKLQKNTENTILLRLQHAQTHTHTEKHTEFNTSVFVYGKAWKETGKDTCQLVSGNFSREL